MLGNYLKVCLLSTSMFIAGLTAPAVFAQQNSEQLQQRFEPLMKAVEANYAPGMISLCPTQKTLQECSSLISEIVNKYRDDKQKLRTEL